VGALGAEAVSYGICVNHDCRAFERRVEAKDGDCCMVCEQVLCHESGLTWADWAAKEHERLNPRIRYTLSSDRDVRTEHFIFPQAYPVMDWIFVDECGHTHQFNAEGKVTTVEWVVTDSHYCSDCRDDHEEGEWRCEECGSVVKPKYDYRTPPPMQVAGRWSYTLTLPDFDDLALPISKDDYEACVAGGVDKVEEIMKRDVPAEVLAMYEARR
jgi:hypothetical protein